MKYWPNGFLATLSLCAALLSGTAFAQQSYFSGWSSYAGGYWNSDSATAVAMDSQTNTYFGGYLGNQELLNDDGVLPTANAFLPQAGGEDGYVAKTDPYGHLLWYTLLCGSEADRVSAVAVHTNGTVYAAGIISRTGDGTDEGTDATLTALSGATGADTWTVALGNFGGTNAFNAVAVDSNGYIYAAGYTSVSNLPNTVSGSSYKGKTDAFVVKVSPAGSVLWSRYLGGTNDESAAALALAPDGSVYVGGQTRTPGWTSVPAAATSPSSPDGFVAKLTSSGAQVWSACFGGSASNAVTALAKSPSTSALFLGGATTSSGFLSGTTRLNTHSGGADGFAVKLADAGPTFQTNWCRFFGSTGSDRVTSLALKSNGLLAVGGNTASGGWLTQAGASTFRGVQDGFLSLLATDGAVWWSSYVGGSNRDDVSAIAVSADKWVAGGGTYSPYPLGWVNGGFSDSWSKDADFDLEPDFDADLSSGLVATWTVEPGVIPSVTDQPDDLTVNEGSPAVLSLAAAGTAPLSYRWFRNGALLAGQTSNTYAIAAAATTNNGDVYCCLVSNFYGTAASSNATLTVIAKGSLTVTLAPAQAVSQGAKWRVNGGAPWFASGASTNLPPGLYTVSFTNLTGWTSPAALDVQVTSSSATATTGVYAAVMPSATRAISGTNVTVTVSAPAGLSTWTLAEHLPEGVTPTNITAGGVWNSGTRDLTFTGAEATTNSYSYLAVCATSGLYTVSGTVTPLPANVPAAVSGDSQILRANFIRTITGTNIVITVTQPSTNIRWNVYEYLPGGLDANTITGPLIDYDAGTIYWTKKGTGMSLTYTVTGVAGTYTLSGEGQIGTGNYEPIFGDSVVTILPPQPPLSPDILSFIPTGSNTCYLAFTSVVSQTYLILTNAAVGATNGWSVWQPVTGEGGVTQREVPMPGPQLFYRVRVQQ